MKRIVPLIFLVSILTCCPIRANNYNGAWNKPTIGTGSRNYDFYFFGQIGYRDRSFQEDTLYFPAIPGLSHKSVYSLCPTDTCFAKYTVLALHCPPIRTLLDWMSDKVYTFVNRSSFIGARNEDQPRAKEIAKESLWSAGSICDYYMRGLGSAHENWQCDGLGDRDNVNEQEGLLIVDCWKSGPLYTFYEGTWYDMLSNGDTTRNSYRTIDSRTGKELTLSDFVDPANYDALSALMMPRLFNALDELLVNKYSNIFSVDNKRVLAHAGGCALIREGLIIYFYPYSLASGADGDYHAIIPYNELEGILKIK